MQISTKVLAILVGLLMISLMVVAYLLGRESSRRGAQPPQPPPSMAIQDSPAVTPAYSPTVPTSFPGPVAPYTPPPYIPPQSPTEAPVKVLPRFDPAPGGIAAPPGLPGGGTYQPGPHRPQATQQAQQGQGSGDRAAVESYFTQVDQIAQAAKSWDDPNAMAQECLKAAMAGDTSGLDKLISSYRTVQKELGTLTPPADCTEHRRMTIEVLGKSVGVLDTIKRGIVSGDMSALSSLQFDAQAIKEKGEAVEQLTQRIKNRYGIR